MGAKLCSFWFCLSTDQCHWIGNAAFSLERQRRQEKDFVRKVHILLEMLSKRERERERDGERVRYWVKTWKWTANAQQTSCRPVHRINCIISFWASLSIQFSPQTNNCLQLLIAHCSLPFQIYTFNTIQTFLWLQPIGDFQPFWQCMMWTDAPSIQTQVGRYVCASHSNTLGLMFKRRELSPICSVNMFCSAIFGRQVLNDL